jgi:hypothetical protein
MCANERKSREELIFESGRSASIWYLFIDLVAPKNVVDIYNTLDGPVEKFGTL